MPSMKFCIDSHCHMFTIADIPLYRMMEQAIDDHSNLGTYALLFLVPFINAQEKIKDYKTFISYFESEPQQNVARMVTEFADARKPYPELSADNVVLTPVIMDFDINGRVTKLNAQVARLKTAANANPDKNTKILPFLGIDPRRGVNGAAGLIKSNDVRSVKERGGYENTTNGDFIGIKLYPPLGFDVYPDNNPEPYLAVYRLLADRGLPITVHCQEGSLNLIDKNVANEYTHPRNWEEVLKKCPDLRINFAHFGSEDEVERTIMYVTETNEPLPSGAIPNINTKTWTYSIIRMLKQYPNAYSDISAFDFANDPAVTALNWLLYLDKSGQLFNAPNAQYKLEDKLLWGSDYPMPLGKKLKTYSDIMESFISSFKGGAYPPYMNNAGFLAFEKKIFCDNPQLFLLG
jgi:predicted TIM-barrel fold metal-dependent hydrolase